MFPPPPHTLRPELRDLFDHARRLAPRYRLQFDTVQTFCLFLGYPRSGHTLLAALLAAHPDTLISIELDALRFVDCGFSREQLFTLILERAATDKGLRSYQYSYRVEGQWQGRARSLRVIGDKEGGMTNLRLRWNPTLLDQLVRLVAVPVRIIHVVRNPFDTATTMVTRGDADSLSHATETFLRFAHNARSVLDRCAPEHAPASAPLAAITLHHEQLVADPRRTLARAVRFLGLEPEPDFLNACAAVVFDTPRRSRHDIDWPPALIESFSERLAHVPFTASYRF